MKKLAGNEIKNIQVTLEQLAEREPAFIYRLEKGKYVTRNFRDEYVIGNYLVQDGVIAYWSALNLHGLTVRNAAFFLKPYQSPHSTRMD